MAANLTGIVQRIGLLIAIPNFDLRYEELVIFNYIDLDAISGGAGVSHKQ